MTISRFHTNIDGLGTNAIWHVGEYLEPQDRRILLLWTSSDIRNTVLPLLQNWINTGLLKLGHTGSSLTILDNAFYNHSLEQIAQKILRTVANIQNSPSHLPDCEKKAILNFLQIFYGPRLREVISSKDTQTRDKLLCDIINDENVSSARALELSKCLSDDTQFRRNASLNFCKNTLQFCLPIATGAATVFLAEKALELRAKRNAIREEFNVNRDHMRSRQSEIVHLGDEPSCLRELLDSYIEEERIINLHESFFSELMGLVYGPMLTLCFSRGLGHLNVATLAYQHATSGKNKITRKEWKYPRIFLATAVIAPYIFFRTQQKSASSLISVLSRAVFDSIFFVSALAEVRSFLGR